MLLTKSVYLVMILNLVGEKLKCNCKKCGAEITKDNDQKCYINDKTYLKIRQYCKFCLPNKYILTNNSGQLLLNRKLFREDYVLEQFNRLGLNINDMISIKMAFKKYKIQTPRIRKFINLNLIKPFYIYPNPFSKNEKNTYFITSELTKCINLFENGTFHPISAKIIEKFGPPVHNPPFFINSNGFFYTYHDKISKQISCNRCKNIMSDYEFGCEKSKLKYCSNCLSQENRLKYNKLSKEEKQFLSQKAKEWAARNREKFKKYRKNAKNILLSRIRGRARSLVVSFLNKKVSNRKYYLTIGATKQDFLNHIESQFLPGMNWENYGPGFTKNENGETIKVKQWNIDHIIPLSSFDLNDPDILSKVNKYTNLQPMWAEDNNKKRDLSQEQLDKEEFYEKYKEIKNLIASKEDKEYIINKIEEITNE
jgi:hypothetical protein